MTTIETKNSTPQIGIFETNRLRLRHLSIYDADRIQKILTKRVCEFVPEIHHPINVVNWINEKLQSNSSYMSHAIILKEINKIIGFIQMFNGSMNINKNYYAIDIGYWFGEDYWNKGYCSEVLKAITKIVETNNWTQEVIALVYDGNKWADKVLLKSGFVNSNIRRKTKYGEASLFVYESEYYKKYVKDNPEWKY